jgi:transposase
VEQQIKKSIEDDPELETRIKAICSIKGVGTITAATIVGETNGFALFNSKAQLVSYAGYDVVKEQSGTSLDSPGKISKKGNVNIRKALYFPAITAVKHDPLFNKMFKQVMDKTKIKMKGYVAVQRKLLVLIYTIYKSGQKFDPNYVSVKKPNLVQTQTNQAETSAPA